MLDVPEFQPLPIKLHRRSRPAHCANALPNHPGAVCAALAMISTAACDATSSDAPGRDRSQERMLGERRRVVQGMPHRCRTRHHHHLCAVVKANVQYWTSVLR